MRRLHPGPSSFGARRIGDGRLSWQELLRTDPKELARIVEGFGNTVSENDTCNFLFIYLTVF